MSRGRQCPLFTPSLRVVILDCNYELFSTRLNTTFIESGRRWVKIDKPLPGVADRFVSGSIRSAAVEVVDRRKALCEELGISRTHCAGAEGATQRSLVGWCHAAGCYVKAAGR